MNPYALLDPAVSSLHHALVALAAALPFADPGVRFAVALALVTVGVRLALLPLSVRSLRAQRARATLEPQLADVRRRHARDRQRLLAETARVHREAGVPRTGGLLVGLAQLPVLATVYRLVVVPTVGGSTNLLLATHLFGAPMAAHWLEVVAVGGLLSPGALAFVVLVGALLVLAAVSSRDVAQPAAAAAAGTGKRPATRAGSGTADAAADVAATVQRVMRFLPFGTVVVALFAPVAMGIYLLVTTAWTVAERRTLNRLIPA